jgi:hypothetical protein
MIYNQPKVVICKDEKTNKLLENYINEFISYKGFKIIGVDFEFNRIKNERKIALCQINFVKENKMDIFLFYPPNIKKDLFKNLLISDCIKILHGSESLDLPYLFDNIIDNNDRDKFCNNLIDTRYLCEYYNSSNNIDGKCRIYDLLLNMKVISKTKYEKLMKNDKLMGNIWEINIDVSKQSFINNKKLIKYCVYDVLFLSELFNKFPKNEIYHNIIPEIGCVVFILRYENKLDKLFSEISSHNLKKYIENYNYNDVYIYVFEWIMIDNFMYNLYQINYFRKFIDLLIKNILYNYLDNSIKLINFDLKNKKILNLINKYINEII